MTSPGNVTAGDATVLSGFEREPTKPYKTLGSSRTLEFQLTIGMNGPQK